ncbi:MAG: ftsK/SpoIIIE family protein [Bacillales bacterium]|jgi:S-DNA-T family DNA segregation ATPase FtsK/SpoIIIE|nr:ftsK/SpoIIIE family protein [Bacillales bacterium]
MFKWFNRLLSNKEDEQQEVEINKDNNSSQREVIGKFRFPIVPDNYDFETESTNQLQVNETKIKSADIDYYNFETENKRRKERMERIKETQDKHSFKTTSFVSPVHGNSTKVNISKPINNPSTFENVKRASSNLDLYSTLYKKVLENPISKEKTTEKSSEELDEYHQDVENSFPIEVTSVAELQIEERIATEEIILKEEIPNADIVEAQVFEEAVIIKEDLVQKESIANRVPFNVIMFREDKEKLQESKVTHTGAYNLPKIDLLKQAPSVVNNDNDWIIKQAEVLDKALHDFNVGAKVVNYTAGPSVTRYEVQPEPGVKVNKITNLADDLKLCLSAKDIRIEAPIPGKNTVGIEVPNKNSRPVFLREIIQSNIFAQSSSPLTVALGLDIGGAPIITDLQKMPHGLIAGSTGSGKSVCINSILVSIMYKANPSDVKLMLIDPKMVELAPYNDIPHLICPVITDVKAATQALKWAVEEMERRYELFASMGVRDLSRYNEIASQDNTIPKQPLMLIIIDELADLMMVSPQDVEEAICRIAQKARACGIHLLLATQRPSVDVITGLIKANVPTRTAFSVASQIDSRTILDTSGAEKLLGKGDMLFLANGSSKPVRLQGTFVSDDEIEKVVSFVRNQQKVEYMFNQEHFINISSVASEDKDDLFKEACEFVVSQGSASTSMIQRRYRIGYNRAARLIDMMEDYGVISSANGSKARDVLISQDDLDALN